MSVGKETNQAETIAIMNTENPSTQEQNDHQSPQAEPISTFITELLIGGMPMSLGLLLRGEDWLGKVGPLIVWTMIVTGALGMLIAVIREKHRIDDYAKRRAAGSRDSEKRS